MGRKGDPGELPPISSLSASWQKFIGPRGFVAPLAGKVFLDRWGNKTAAELIARFQETVDDPYLKFEGMTDETTVNITAYVLQVNGAKAGTEPLTRTTGTIVRSVTRPSADNVIPQEGAAFEVASVKINRSSDRPRISIQPESGTVTITAISVQEVILTAYKLQSFYLVAINSPVLKQRVDIIAKAPSSTTAAELQRMLQPLLAERFNLRIHRETREMNALLLARVDSNKRLGPQIKPSDALCADSGSGTNRVALARGPATAEGTRCGFMPTEGPGRIRAIGIDLQTLAGTLAPSQGRPVLDQTGLDGRYDVDVTYTPEVFSTSALARRGAVAPPQVDPDGPPLSTALREQLGLKLEPKRVPLSVLVIDRIDPLIEN
jgi:uncharacterized protein (TIGR03435 family)